MKGNKMMDMAQTIGGDLIDNNIDITTFEVGMFDGEFKNPQYCMMEIG